MRLARTAAEAIRGLNWLTGCEAGLGQPSAAYDVIGALALAASRLHQALAQITGWLDQALAAGRLGHDLGEDPAAAIDAAGIFLGDAGLSAAALAGDLEPPSSSSPSSTAAPAPHPEGTAMIEKLQAHYGFTRMPFGRDLAPGMLHRHAAHNEACARITWCIAERAIGVITGEVGAGKTVSVRTVLAGLDASRHTIIYLPNPMIGIRGLHEMIVATFGGQPDRSYSRLTAQASAMLAAERDERGKTPVLVIDEAHLLRYEQLETIRMLTNHNLDADSPLACLLIGQPTLRRTMKLAVLAALEQRTALRYAMPPMTSQETSSYISHHLKLAGRSDPLFSDDAATLIHTTSRGYPRAVNNLAIQALVATYAAGKAIVDEQAARAAVTEVTDT